MKVAYQIANNIFCPLGQNTKEVVDAMLKGSSSVAPQKGFDGCEPLCASMFKDNQIEKLPGYSLFESMAIVSVSSAIKKVDLDVSKKDVLFILSTTKGNVELLEESLEHRDELMLWHSANKIANYFDNSNVPVVVSNACISGTAALIMAQRYLLSKQYNYVVVVGADKISKFIVSGFQSFKALSPELCKSFDKDRVGLNLGEAAATMVLGCANLSVLKEGTKYIVDGAIRNDANHISAPSRTAEGLHNAISHCNLEDVGFVVAHGTATPYNDQMEAIAIQRSNIEHLPVFSLKAYVGHTLGAAGLLETIIGCELLDREELPENLNFKTLGVEGELNVTQKRSKIKAKAFLKTISGFGGANAAIVMRKV